MTLVVVGILLLLAASAFTSGTETAMTSLDRSRVHQLAETGQWRARILERLLADRESLIGALLVGNNIFNILAASLATDVLITLTGHSGVVYATFIMTVLVVIFSEILPKTYALRFNERFALFMAPAARVLVVVLWPAAMAAGWIVGQIFRILPTGGADKAATASERIRGTLQFMANQGSLAKSERDMLGGVLDLDHVEVGQIMTHRRKIFSVDVATPAIELEKMLVNVPHSRIPVHDQTPDHIVGVVTIRDLFERRRDLPGLENLHGLMKAPWFVPETRPIRSQLQAFRAKRAHMAFVVDEYGDLQGLITLEDIIEEIVGEIDDETDAVGNEFSIQADGSVIALAAASVRDLNRAMDWNLPEDDASTLGGLVTEVSERIPSAGETVDIADFRVTILAHEGNWLENLRIFKRPPDLPSVADTPKVGDAGQN